MIENDVIWQKEHKDKMMEVFKTAWENNERGAAYLTFTEELPDKLSDYGLVNSRVKMSEYVFFKLIEKHKFSEEELLSIKEAINNPVAILREKGKIIIVTDIVDYQKFPVTVILAANVNDNCVASIYGRLNIVNYVYGHSLNNNVLYADLDRLECIKEDRTSKKINKRLDEIKKNILKSRGCKLKMTIERNGEKIELTETEIWAAYSLVNDNITEDIKQEAEEILNQENQERGR